jgi:defect-in-organelle-trafficking protein DotD
MTQEGGMGGTAMRDWSGPIEPLLQKIASLTNYQLKILGQTPNTPVLVSLEGNERIIADILKDAGLQAGKQATIVVYPGVRIIELRYQNR